MRIATPNDVHLILEFSMQSFIENQKEKAYPVGFDVFMARWYIETMLKQGAICYIADDGVILGRMTSTWFGENPYAAGVIFYVKPEVRKTSLPVRLLAAYDKDAKNRGARGRIWDTSYKAKGDLHVKVF